MPSNWRNAHPGTYTIQDQSISVSVNGGAQVSGLLRYGKGNFQSGDCNAPWVAGHPDTYGRICIGSTAGPFYSGFATASAASDYCSASNQLYFTQTCDNSTLLFVIFIR